MNTYDDVIPARIIVVGTSKIQLSERFKGLDILRRKSLNEKKIPFYDRHCRNLSKEEEVVDREKNGQMSPVVRFKFNSSEEISSPFKLYSDSLYRKPIQHRLTFKSRFPSHQNFFRRPIRQNNFSFKRSFPRRFFGEWRSWYGGNWNNNNIGYNNNRRDGGGYYRNNYRRNNKQRSHKKTVAEMDRELEEYMKSNKHPRVNFRRI